MAYFADFHVFIFYSYVLIARLLVLVLSYMQKILPIEHKTDSVEGVLDLLREVYVGKKVGRGIIIHFFRRNFFKK